MSSGQVVTKEPLIRQVTAYLSPEEVALVDKAFYLAEKMHDGQKRKSGEPYLMHPYEVAMTLASLEADGATVATQASSSGVRLMTIRSSEPSS